MRIINLGSLNIDYIYRVGLNQFVALGRAGADAYHAGLIGDEKAGLLNILEESAVDTHLIRTCPVQTGHAFIQVASSGQNSIIVYGGSNKQITVDYISEAFCDFGKDDMLLLQNEISCTEEASIAGSEDPD